MDGISVEVGVSIELGRYTVPTGARGKGVNVRVPRCCDDSDRVKVRVSIRGSVPGMDCFVCGLDQIVAVKQGLWAMMNIVTGARDE